MADLFHRVSIRKFKDEAVSNEDIGYILEAAMAAPSAKNQQPWEFYVVENREVLKQLGESSPFSAPAGKAPVAIVTAYREECDLPEFAQIDMSIMMENLWLAADEIGLGGVWPVSYTHLDVYKRQPLRGPTVPRKDVQRHRVREIRLFL